MKHLSVEQSVQHGQRGWVVFSGETEFAWLQRLLKPGFRHCYLLLHDGCRWLSFEPLANHSEITVHHDIAGDFDLPRWLLTRGYCLVPAPVDRGHKEPAPLMFFTCVEAVKRMLGLHARFVVTPWQLYRHLTNLNQGKETSNGSINLNP